MCSFFIFTSFTSFTFLPTSFTTSFTSSFTSFTRIARGGVRRSCPWKRHAQPTYADPRAPKMAKLFLSENTGNLTPVLSNKKNDAWQFVRLPAHAGPRTLDFNVAKVRTKPIYIKRHFSDRGTPPHLILKPQH